MVSAVEPASCTASSARSNRVYSVPSAARRSVGSTALALAIAIRTGFEPGDAPALADSVIHHGYDDTIAAGVPVAAAGPTNATTALRSYRHGEWESIAATILLPRKGAVMGALARALVPSQVGERRALTVFFRPVGQGLAERTTGRAEMSAAMATEVRRKVGRVERARDRRAVEQVHETDEKLERGRSLVRLSSALAITVPAAWNAQDYGRRLDASVRLCGFTPLPLDGAHDAAFAAAVDPARDRTAQEAPELAMARRRTTSRSVDHLLTDFGSRLPRRDAEPPEPPADKPFPRVIRHRGVRKAGHGWAPTLPPLAGYQMTSEQTPVMWPLIAGDGLPPTGAPMGFNVLSGGSFYCDPMGWVNDDTIPVTNPNVFIFGKPGRGKSALVKAFMLRMIRFGYRSLVLGDVKDEYEDISRALGVEPYRIGPGLPGRINPLGCRAARPGLGTAGPRRDRAPSGRHLQPLARAHPRARRLPAGPVHADRSAGDQPRPA